METLGIEEKVHRPLIAPGGALYQVVARLREHAERSKAGSATDDEHLASIRLAEALLRYQISEHPPRPTQVAVLGPTQTGKSTVVNLLADAPVAAVSPLAGFTIHPQAFLAAATEQVHVDDAWTAEIFPGYDRVAVEELCRDRLRQYTFARIAAPADTQRAAPFVLWDSPDFDSVAAGTYQHALLELTALADVYVLVLSKEKYSDLAAWRMLRLVEPLRRPLIVVLNKLTPDAREPITNSLQTRFAELGGGWTPNAIHTIGYIPRNGKDESPELRDAAGRLRRCLADVLEATPAPAPQATALLIRRHWDGWTASLRAQHAAFEEWQALVREAAGDFVAAYRRDFLDHPQRYDSFRRAAVELLVLLEIPKLSAALTTARRVVTWPLRRVLSTGRELFRDRVGVGPPQRVLNESTVLAGGIDRIFATLQRAVARRCVEDRGRGFWHALDKKLESESERLRSAFAQAIHEHDEAVNRAIHEAAGSMFEELKAHPARLAAMRAGRATLDAGALVLTLKTGGLTPLDVVWAPATFALTSFLMEGFAGVQMSHNARRLKEQQHAAVKRDLADAVVIRELTGVAHESPDLIDVTPGNLARAEEALAAMEAGA